jgi:hypothetical protein
MPVKTNENTGLCKRNRTHAGDHRLKTVSLPSCWKPNQSPEISQAEASLKEDKRRPERSELKAHQKDVAALNLPGERRISKRTYDTLLPRYERIRKFRGESVFRRRATMLICQVRIRPQVFQETAKRPDYRV